MSNLTKQVVSSDGDVGYLGSLFGYLKPAPIDFTVVDVGINADNSVFTAFCDAFLGALRDSVSFRGNGTIPVSEDDLRAYLRYAVFARISWVRKEQSGLAWFRTDDYMVPSFLSVFLAQLGIVEKADLGLRLVPSWVGEKPVIEKTMLARISSLFKLLESHGFEMVTGLPRKDSGSWAMMSMELIETRVRATTAEHHPSFAVMASFFGVTGLAQVLGAEAYRVVYVTTKQVESMAYEAVSGAKTRN